VRGSLAADVVPRRVKDQLASRNFPEIAMFCVERRVVLEENNAMSQAVKALDEASPKGRVPVAP
jgi:hypothetical protein